MKNKEMIITKIGMWLSLGGEEEYGQGKNTQGASKVLAVSYSLN